MRPRIALAAALAVIALSSTVARADEMPQPVLQWGTFGSGPGQFKYCDGLAIDENDVIYVCDQQNNRIQKFDTSGVYLGEFGTFGTAPGQLFHDTGITLAPDGNLYITEHQNHRISVWTRDGAFLRVFPFHDRPDSLSIRMAWPVGIDVDAAGNVYFTDYQGTYKAAPDGNLIWRSNGGLPYGLTLGPDGLVYVSECGGDRITKYTRDGALVGTISGSGRGPGQVDCAEGSAFDADGNFWVCDTGNDRVEKFSPTGAFLGLFYLDPRIPGERVVPADLAFDSHGNLYVSRWNNHFVEKYSFGLPGNQRPICYTAQALIERNWPANHQMEPVTITGPFDPEGHPVTVRVVGITQDEPVDGSEPDSGAVIDHGHGPKKCPDGELHADGSASVRRERDKNGNGRVYELTFVATDDRGATCQGAVRVCMPADPESLCVNDGQTVNSLGPCFRGNAVNEPIEAVLEPAFGHFRQEGALVSLEYQTTGDDVKLAMFDIAGRRIATLFTGPQTAGAHIVEWSTAGLGRGVYFGRLSSGGVTKTKTIVVR